MDYNYRNAPREREKHAETSKAAWRISKYLKELGYRFTKLTGTPGFEFAIQGQPRTDENFQLLVNTVVPQFGMKRILTELEISQIDIEPILSYSKTTEVDAYNYGKYIALFIKIEEYVNTQTHLVLVLDPDLPVDPHAGHVPRAWMVYFGHR